VHNISRLAVCKFWKYMSEDERLSQLHQFFQKCFANQDRVIELTRLFHDSSYTVDLIKRKAESGDIGETLLTDSGERRRVIDVALDRQKKVNFAVRFPQGQQLTVKRLKSIDIAVINPSTLIRKCVKYLDKDSDQDDAHYVLLMDDGTKAKGDRPLCEFLRRLPEQPDAFLPIILSHVANLDTTLSPASPTGGVLKIGGQQDIAKFLRGIPLFSKLNDVQSLELATHTKRGNYSQGERIVTQGHAGGKFHIIFEGKAVGLVKQMGYQGHNETELFTLRMGDYFGHEPLLLDDAHAYSVIATSHVVTLWIRAQSFVELFAEKLNVAFGKRHPLQFEPTRQMIRRVRRNSPRPVKRRRVPDSVQKLIHDSLMSCEIFWNLESEKINALIETMSPVDLGRGVRITTQGEEINEFFVIEHGEATVVINDPFGNEHVLRQVLAGETIGALSMLYNCAAPETIITNSEDTRLWMTTKHDFKKILLTKTSKKLLDFQDALKRMEILSALLEAERQRLAEVIDEVNFDKGDNIVKEGSRNYVLYLIRSGCAQVSVRDKEVFRLGPGDYFGMYSLMRGLASNCTVKPIGGPLCTLTVDHDTFHTLLQPLHDTFTYAIDRRNERIEDVQANQIRNYIGREHINKLRLLGRGAFGEVHLVEHRETHQQFALKCVSKGHVMANGEPEYIIQEKNIMLMLDSPFLIKLYSAFQDEQWCYFLLELGLGGQLWDLLTVHRRFSDDMTRFYTACLMLGLEHMHERGVIYRDLKPENALLDSTGYLKITDFGFGKIIGDQKTTTMCGTPDYIPPEIVRGVAYSFGADWWTLGICIYEMLCGQCPFQGDEPRRYPRLLKADIWFNPDIFSKNAQAIVKDFCKVNPSDRLGVLEGGTTLIKDHDFFKEAAFDWASLRARTLPAPHVPQETPEFVEDDEDEVPFKHFKPDHYTKSLWDEF